MSDLAAALLRDVPRFNVTVGDHTDPSVLLLETEVLAALSARLDADLAEQAGEVLPRLRKADEYEPLGHDVWEAADLITTLLAQNAALRAERDAAEQRGYANAMEAERKLHEDRIEALEAKLAKAGGLLEAWVELSEHCSIEEGVCCCGESMNGHSNPMDCGHTPLDHGAYIAVQLGEKTRAALTAALDPALAERAGGVVEDVTQPITLQRIGTGLYETQSDYRLAPHLQSIVEAAKTAPQWDTVNDRMAPLPDTPDPSAHVNETPKREHDAGNVLTGAAEAQIAALSRALDPALTERAERISTECLQAAEVMQDTNTFQTGQAIFLDAADMITALLAQNAALRAERDRFEAALARACLVGGTTYLIERAEAAEAEVEKLRGELQNATEAKLDAISTLDAWFDRRKLGHDAVDQAVVDAASGYLRTSRVGGMQQAESDLILGVMRDMARLGLFADLFARAALKETTMSDEELIARLRAWDGTPFDDDAEAAADRIEALVKERDEALEWLSASQGYIADAVFALDKQEKAEARAKRLEAAIRELQHRWYLGDLQEMDFAAALTTEASHDPQA